jgi:predicted TPR repeat methyltransferase
MSKHSSQTTDGDLAARHASVLLAKNPTELEAAYDQWATQYDDDLVAISGLPPGQWGLSAINVMLKTCQPISAFPNLLDFGCGTGHAGPHLNKAGWTETLHGCDLSGGMLQVAASRNAYTKLIKSTFDDSHTQAGFYHVIHASGVFAPGQAPPSVFDEFLKALQVGGMAFFTVRKEYYEGPEGAAHKEHLEDLCDQQKWELVSQTQHVYLPKDNITCFVFCMKKL